MVILRNRMEKRTTLMEMVKIYLVNKTNGDTYTTIISFSFVSRYLSISEMNLSVSP